MNVIKKHTLWIGWCVGCGTPVSSPTALNCRHNASVLTSGGQIPIQCMVILAKYEVMHA